MFRPLCLPQLGKQMFYVGRSLLTELLLMVEVGQRCVHQYHVHRKCKWYWWCLLFLSNAVLGHLGSLWQRYSLPEWFRCWNNVRLLLVHFCGGLQQRQHIFSGTVIYFIDCITSFRRSWHPFTPCAYCEPLPTFTIVYAHCFLPFLEAYVCGLLNVLLHMP